MNWLIPVALGGVGAALTGLMIHQRQRILELRRDYQRVEQEEVRIFEFLHGLELAFCRSSAPSKDELQGVIVRGAMKVSGATSGAVYMSDAANSVLRPGFMESGFPVLFEGDGEMDRATLRRQLRLRSIRKGEGVLGRAYESGQMQASDEQDGHVAAVPMKHGDRCVGILALVRDASGEPFSEEEHRVLDAIAEQSAFALFTADIFFEAAEKRTMEKDLQVAHEVQRILLPGTLPDFGGYEIAGVNVPARHVSGDYYEFIEVSPRHRGLAIADVSGKGVPASLLMAMCRSVLRCVADGEESAAKALRRLNRHLYPDIREDMFISMAYTILDGETSTVRLARAGHDAPLWYHALDGSITRISPPGLAIGIDDGPVFDRVTGDLEVVLEAGDMIVFFTDGVTEALDAQGDEFGMDRLMACVREAASGGALSVVEGITARVGEFAKDQPRHDDVTLVVLRRK